MKITEEKHDKYISIDFTILLLLHVQTEGFQCDTTEIETSYYAQRCEL
jgi:hypothetical protein